MTTTPYQLAFAAAWAVEIRRTIWIDWTPEVCMRVLRAVQERHGAALTSAYRETF